MYLISDALKVSGTHLPMQSKWVGTKWGHRQRVSLSPFCFGPGTATVNTYTLNVTCGTLGGDTVAAIDPDLADNLTTYAVCGGEKRWVRSVSASAIIVAF
jgi:hypothetical protein